MSCDVGYPVNSLSKKFKENEGKSILLTCIITYIFHHHLLQKKRMNRCEAGLDHHGRQIPGDAECNQRDCSKKRVTDILICFPPLPLGKAVAMFSLMPAVASCLDTGSQRLSAGGCGLTDSTSLPQEWMSQSSPTM